MLSGICWKVYDNPDKQALLKSTPKLEHFVDDRFRGNQANQENLVFSCCWLTRCDKLHQFATNYVVFKLLGFFLCYRLV